MNPIKIIDSFLNQITMYRLVLYYLIGLLLVSLVLSIFGVIPYSPFSIIYTTFFLIAMAWITNTIFALVFRAQTNLESVYITALILALILSPAGSVSELIFLGWVAVLSMASKYILVIGKKHIFNPVAIAIAITAYTINQSASWWIATLPMFPFVLFGGLLVTRKVRRFDLVATFIAIATLTVAILSVFKGADPVSVMRKMFVDSPILFFAFAMLTEPLTSPPTRTLQILYGTLVGVLFAPQLHIGAFYTTPEIALLVGNIFSFIVSPKDKLILVLKERVQRAPDIYDFIFTTSKKIHFKAGQYMEWTLAHKSPDARGTRRFFSLASSPTESELVVGVRFYTPASSYKRALLSLNENTPIVASQLSGDFTLPKDPSRKLVFIAGGIGITPFRSIVKYLVDQNDRRSAILIYSNKTSSEIVYKDVFDEAALKLGLKTIYTLTDSTKTPPNWTGHVGRITPELIKAEIPDYAERLFYLSGPRSMVVAYEEVLQTLGVRGRNIKTDYFPGFV